MMTFLFLLLLAFSIHEVNAQTRAQCTSQNYEWARNSLGQTPCDVADFLGRTCADGFLLEPFSEGQIAYLGPRVDQINDCQCSSVLYSVVSTCAACQDRSYLPWSRWSRNCTTVSIGNFTEDIPPGTRVPHWAYQNVSVSDNFNLTLAQIDAFSDAPESSAASTPTSSSSSSPDDSGGGSSGLSGGAIAGIVVGVVVFAALVAALIFWYIRHRRRPSHAVDLTNDARLDGYSTTPSPFTLHQQQQQPPMRLYDPSDPSTFPPPTTVTPAPSSTVNTTLTSEKRHQRDLSGGSYPGTPEV